MTKTWDAIPIIQNAVPGNTEQLRAAAITRMTDLRNDIHSAIQVADENYRAKEQEFLEAVARWRRADSSTERAKAAQEVGVHQNDLQKLDEIRQMARYPHRFIQKQELTRTVIDADSKDMRKIPHPVFVERIPTSDPIQRSIQVS